MKTIEHAMRRVLPAAVDDGLDVLRGGIETRVPIGKTRTLAAGIATSQAKERREGYVEGDVSVTADYVASVEFGDVDQPARPFIRPTADIDGPRAVDAIAKSIGKRLK